jgi:hypothetical protein
MKPARAASAEERSPSAIRLRRPGWRDPRLLIGLMLVAFAVALGSWAVTAAGRTIPVLAAPGPLVPGDALDFDDLVVREVRLAEAESRYLKPGDTEHDDPLIVVRTIGAGELVPVDAVASREELDLRSVALTPARALSAGVVPGAVVDLWLVPAPRTEAEPQQLASALTVAQVAERTTAFNGTGDSTVYVLVPVDQLAEVLGALATDGSVEIVPVAGSVPAS